MEEYEVSLGHKENNMPAKSKAQLRFMAGVASGKIKKKGLSPMKAREFVTGVSYKRLPTRKRKR